MTDQPDDELGPLPDIVTCTTAFMARLPSQRVLDALSRLEGGTKFGELIESQTSRMMAFRALLRDYPRRDMTTLWLHAYDVEVAIEDVDPTVSGSSPISPPSVPTTT